LVGQALSPGAFAWQDSTSGLAAAGRRNRLPHRLHPCGRAAAV